MEEGKEKNVKPTPKKKKNTKSCGWGCPISAGNGHFLTRLALLFLLLFFVLTLTGFEFRWEKSFPFWSFHRKNPSISGQNLKDSPKTNGPIGSPSLSPNLQEEEDLTVGVVDKYSPAVVSIIISKDMPKFERYSFNPFGFDPFFEDNSGFFDDFFGGNLPNQNPNPGNSANGNSQKVEIGGGTGFIVSKDGMIVTNKHVVSDDKAEYTVITSDGKKYDAKVLGRARNNDVAVIKVDPQKPQEGEGKKELEMVNLGDSSNVKIGQTVIAIGNALGEFRNTVSKGIISGLSRDIVAGGGGSSEELEQLIQTDAAINQGNSGGPLINLRGEVIGINVAIAAGAQNIGFAIPINSVKNIIRDVTEKGKISQPYIGVRYAMINKEIKERNNLPFDYGALVVRGEQITDLAVIPGSPADRAGLTENDIILEVNGQKIDEKNSLIKTISGFEINKEIELKVWRKGEIKTFKLKVEEAPQAS